MEWLGGWLVMGGLVEGWGGEVGGRGVVGPGSMIV